MYFLTIFASGSESRSVPRFWRICFGVRLIIPWRLPAAPAFTLPDAVILKRFLAPDFVFNFGISHFLKGPFRARNKAAKACLWPGDRSRSGVYTLKSALRKGFRNRNIGISANSENPVHSASKLPRRRKGDWIMRHRISAISPRFDQLVSQSLPLTGKNLARVELI